MTRHVALLARRQHAALAAIAQLESLVLCHDACVVRVEAPDLCRRVERAAGGDAVVSDKLASILRCAQTYGSGRTVACESAARARLIMLAGCSSVRAMLDRLAAE